MWWWLSPRYDWVASLSSQQKKSWGWSLDEILMIRKGLPRSAIQSLITSSTISCYVVIRHFSVDSKRDEYILTESRHETFCFSLLFFWFCLFVCFFNHIVWVARCMFFIIPSFGLMFEFELFVNTTYPYLVTFMLEIMQDILKVKETIFFSVLLVVLFSSFTPSRLGNPMWFTNCTTLF